MSKRKYKVKKKYVVITKVGGKDFKKWRTNDLLKFKNFLDKSYPAWRWFNVFCNKEKTQIASFTKNNPPLGKDI